MNVYDFDKTIYYPDSSHQFFLFCLKRFPGKVLSVVPRGLLLALRYGVGAVDFRELKEQFFAFLPLIGDLDSVVAAFWKKHRDHIQSWYLRQKREDDLIISASPAFLLRPAAEALGVRLIATEMDVKSGKIIGENCHDRAKVKRFYDRFPDGRIDAFYSDSFSDAPLAMEAARAFLVKKEKIMPWPGHDGKQE